MTENNKSQKISLLTATFIVIGSMIGSGIFIVSADMARMLGSPFLMISAWILTGVMTLIAALTYGELASIFPKSGGQYQYLKEVYGDLVGFLFGWSTFAVVSCGTIAAVAVAFAKFSAVIFPMFSPSIVIFQLGSFNITAEKPLAIGSIILLTYLNSKSLKNGSWIQNILTTIKILSFGLLFILAFFIFSNPEVISTNFSNFYTNIQTTSPLTGISLFSAIGVAMVGSLFSSCAWENVTYVSGEIENPKRNVPLAMALGVLTVTIIYLLTNLAYLFVLPFWGTIDASNSVLTNGIQYATQDRVGSAAFTAMLGNSGAILMAAMIMISTFGCNNGLILSAVRIYQSMAQDGLFFQKMKETNSNGIPVFALWIQCVWCCLLCLSGKYGDLLDYVMFVVMIFYILAILAVFILRIKMPNIERPIKAIGYPILPAIYILLASLFTINIFITKPHFTVPGLIIVLIGIPVYYYWKRKIQE